MLHIKDLSYETFVKKEKYHTCIEYKRSLPTNFILIVFFVSANPKNISPYSPSRVDNPLSHYNETLVQCFAYTWNIFIDFWEIRTQKFQEQDISLYNMGPWGWGVHSYSYS